MRLVDRLFAFWRLPAWTDAVQVLLWLVGWGVVLSVAVVGAVGARTLRGLVFTRGEPVFLLAAGVAAVMVLLWLSVGCWVVSEAYGGWRAGHPHGRQWAILIAILLLMNSVPLFFMDADVGPVNLALRAVLAAFGLALLVACVTTKPPRRQPGLAS